MHTHHEQQSYEGYTRAILSEIQALLQQHEEKGDTYNIFRVIHMTSNETSVHSAMIADLLNPHGKHGMKGAFLKLFVDSLPQEHKVALGEFPAENARVKIEEYLGKKTKDSGGRLDIIVRSQVNGISKAIIIENKLYAIDQENQMVRYHNFAKERFPGCHLLLYLSLDGEVKDMERTAKNQQTELVKGKDFYCISYQPFIRDWVCRCRQLVEDKPLIREALSHYINLIDYLTGKSIKMTDKQQIGKMIADQPASMAMLKAGIEEADRELHRRFWHTLAEKIQQDEMLKRYPLSFWQEDESALPTTDMMSALDSHISDYEYNSKHRQFGLSLEIEQREGWKLVFLVTINSNILFYFRATNMSGENALPALYQNLRDNNPQPGWESCKPGKVGIWGDYPHGGLKLSFGKPNSPLYNWCADMDNNIASLVGNIREKISLMEDK